MSEKVKDVRPFLPEGKVVFNYSGVDMEADRHDLDYEKTLSELSDEDLNKELRYFTAIWRRLLQIEMEYAKRKDNKEKN